MSCIIFKIQANDGTYSKGGHRRGFSKNGKTWARASDVSSHLAQLDARGLADYARRGARVVEYDIQQVCTHDIQDWLAGVDERREKRTQAAQVRQDTQRRIELARSIEQKRQELAVLESKQRTQVRHDPDRDRLANPDEFVDQGSPRY